MLKTSKDLMEWLGLQVGDRIRINDKPDNYIVELNECGIPCVKDKYTKIRFEMTYLINRKIEILPRPKRIGDLKCSDEIECKQCPLRMSNCTSTKNSTLYKLLEEIKGIALSGDYFDQEIYDLLKTRLDKGVEE